MSKKENTKKGNWAEDLAAEFLEENGYTILERKFRCRQSEIDIIAGQNETVIFIEVKYRRSLQYGWPREAVGYRKRQSIKRAALYYISGHPSENTDYRFDVIELLGYPEPTIEHIKNAFE